MGLRKRTGWVRGCLLVWVQLALFSAPARSQQPDEAQRTIREIFFIGNQFVSEHVLASHIDSTCARLSRRDGIYDPKTVEADIVRLTEYYRSFGFNDVKVICPEFLFEDPDYYVLNFIIWEGKRSYVQPVASVGTIVISGTVRNDGVRPDTPSTRDKSGVIPAKCAEPCQDTSGVIPNKYMTEELLPTPFLDAASAPNAAATVRITHQRTSVRFVGPRGMKISWYGQIAEGKADCSREYLTAPGRYNFLQAAIYRLKLSNIPQYSGVDLYPTLEVLPVNGKPAKFLASLSVPISITAEDVNRVLAGDLLVKVLYLPSARQQGTASTGVEEINSAQLQPGVNPIAEAQRRGSVLLVMRLGNTLLELPSVSPMP